MLLKWIFWLIFFSISLFGLNIDINSSNIELLPTSEIYIDHNNSLSLKEIKDKKFKKIKTTIFSMGFAPNSALWIRFRLTNKTDKPLTKIIEYANPLTEEIYFFDKNQTQIDGTWHIKKDRFSINPIFYIYLQPKEERVFYIKAHSTISTVIVQLLLWNPKDFYKRDQKHKERIIIFFTIMLTLLLYNGFIYLFTKDRAYFYYLFYLVAIILNESTYSGVAQLFFLSQEATIFVTKCIMLLVAFMVVSIILFSREFLHIYRFSWLDRLYRAVLYFVPTVSILSCNNFLFNSNVIILFLPIAILIIFSGFYALFHGVKEAKFYVIGWSFVLFALMLTNLQTLGILKINEHVKYLNDISFVLEAFLFSIALAHRIKITNEKLIQLQQEEQERLQKLVSIKTKELQESLKQEELLYRELNHRVKNNFQMILSLIKLQILNSQNPKLKTELTTVQNRINSIAYLYEILKIDKHKAHKTKEYFQAIINHIEQIYFGEVEIIYNISIELPINKLIYCGLILNELVTNSFKYAFDKAKGVIKISLYQKGEYIYFIIEDNGKGYKEKEDTNSLGLLIVQTLVNQQLLGKIETFRDRGVKNIISWKI